MTIVSDTIKVVKAMETNLTMALFFSCFVTGIAIKNTKMEMIRVPNSKNVPGPGPSRLKCNVFRNVQKGQKIIVQ